MFDILSCYLQLDRGNRTNMIRSLVLFFLATVPAFEGRVVCYWNGKSFWREGVSKVTTEDIRNGVSFCTHLIYGYAAINDDNYQLEPIDKKLDLDKDGGYGQWKNVTTLKRSHPGLSVLLSIGGYEDTEDMDKYLKLLDKPERRTAFVNSVVALLRECNFDGIDLAWQFPHQEEKVPKSIIGSIWHRITAAFGIGIDKKASLHKDLFIALCSELRAELRPENKTLSIAVLPHVNSTTYFDVRPLMAYVDMVNLWTADFRTPERTPGNADYPHPLAFAQPRLQHQNGEAVVKHWMDNGAQSEKLNLGIATWGRSWILTRDSSPSAIPPLLVDGPAEKGPHTRKKGFLGYFEICANLVSPDNATAPAGSLRRIKTVDSAPETLGVFAYTHPGKVDGQWVGYEDSETAAVKSSYAKINGLGGVAILDLGMDDPQGICEGGEFPITRAAKLRWDITMTPAPLYSSAENQLAKHPKTTYIRL